MTAQETAVLVGALVGLFGAIQAWLVGKSVQHSNQLNGLMAPAIAQGAAAVVIAAQQAAVPIDQTTPKDPAARVIELRKELARLNSVRY
jgi:hypothetical protein